MEWLAEGTGTSINILGGNWNWGEVKKKRREKNFSLGPIFKSVVHLHLTHFRWLLLLAPGLSI